VRDGMFQRIAAIDSLTKNEERVYLNISFKKNKKRKISVYDNCKVESLNYFLHNLTITKYLKKATIIYVHSVYNMLKIFPFGDYKKIILDIHGVVPEEMIFLGKRANAFVYNIIERMSIQKCFKLIHVTSSMKKFYEDKYHICLDKRSIVLPIFEKNKIHVDQNKWNSNMFEFIYAGGMQAWQNIDLMIEESKRTYNKNIKFNFFLPQNSTYEFKSRIANCFNATDIIVDSLPKEDVINVMAKCHLGFVLRDDIVVNRVACPTKLIEYLECGVVPVVKSPDIGDFNSLGYSFIKVDELCSPLKMEELYTKVENNYRVLAHFQSQTEESKVILINIFKGANTEFEN
ncbi:TPA: glycosyl transferase family 2, partial [Escherichia coli]|nr:glycosyl transferase family 2 [Escherichia coli]